MSTKQSTIGFAAAPVGLRLYSVLIWTTPLVGLIRGLRDDNVSVAVLLTTELLLALVGVVILRALLARHRWAWWLSLISALLILTPIAGEHDALWLAPLGIVLLTCLAVPSSRPLPRAPG